MRNVLFRGDDPLKRNRRVSTLVDGQVSVLTLIRMIGVGFSGSKASLEKLPGWEQDSWAYHGDDGKSFCCQSTGKSYGPTFTTNDIIGCGVNFMTGVGFFTKNGVFLGIIVRQLTVIEY